MQYPDKTDYTIINFNTDAVISQPNAILISIALEFFKIADFI